MRMILRLVVLVCVSSWFVVSAQQDPVISDPSAAKPAPAPAQTAEPLTTSAESETTTFRTSVRNIIAPVTVLDRSGGLVEGIEAGRFHLFDNNKEQKIAVDITVQPISLVIAIQQSDRVESVLNQIHRIGPMVQPILTGSDGEAAVISFDSRIQTKQDFTNDPDKLDKAIQNIHAGNTPARMIDAIETGVQKLKTRTGSRRRIILVISETRDSSSEARLRETLIASQLANVTVYFVDISRFVTSLTSTPQPTQMSAIPPAAYNLPGGVPNTPTTLEHLGLAGNRAEFVPMLKELYLGTKRIFVENPAEVFTEGTGGAQFTFKKERGLEDAIESLGREIHSQYLVTYAPNDLTEDGFHQIRVDIDLPDLVIRTRPGYYLAGIGK